MIRLLIFLAPIVLQWEPSIVDETHGEPSGYRVYAHKEAEDGPVSAVKDVGLSLTSSINVDYDSESPLYVFVRAYNEGGESENSNVVILSCSDSARLYAEVEKLKIYTGKLVGAARNPKTGYSYCAHWQAVSFTAKDVWKKVYGTDFPFGGVEPCPEIPALP